MSWMFLLSQSFNDMMGHFLELLHLGSQRSITILFIAPTLHPYLLDGWRNDTTTFPAFQKFTFANEQANLILCTTFPGCGLTFKPRLSALARFRLHFYITIEFDSFHCVRRKTERLRFPSANPVRKRKLLFGLPESSNQCKPAFPLLKYIVFKFSVLVDALRLSAAMDEGDCGRPPHPPNFTVHRNGDAHARTVQPALPRWNNTTAHEITSYQCFWPKLADIM